MTGRWTIYVCPHCDQIMVDGPHTHDTANERAKFFRGQRVEVVEPSAFLSSLADDPPEEMVRAASDAIYEMTRGAKLPGVVNGLQTDHVGSIPLAGAALSAALREVAEGER